MSKLSEALTARAEQLGISQTELAEKVGMAQQSISAIFTGQVSNPRKWRDIARALAMPEDEMQALMIESGEKPGSPVFLRKRMSNQDARPDALIMPDRLPPTRIDRMLPVLGEAVGGVDGEYVFNGHVLDYVACPPSLANVPNAYSVYVDGESMSPRYRSGEMVYVHPNKPARRGDDVIVQIKPREDGMPPRGYIKEFVGWTGSKLMLRQHNPAQSVDFDRELVVSVHPIVLAGKY